MLENLKLMSEMTGVQVTREEIEEVKAEARREAEVAFARQPTSSLLSSPTSRASTLSSMTGPSPAAPGRRSKDQAAEDALFLVGGEEDEEEEGMGDWEGDEEEEEEVEEEEEEEEEDEEDPRDRLMEASALAFQRRVGTGPFATGATVSKEGLARAHALADAAGWEDKEKPVGASKKRGPSSFEGGGGGGGGSRPRLGGGGGESPRASSNAGPGGGGLLSRLWGGRPPPPPLAGGGGGGGQGGAGGGGVGGLYVPSFTSVAGYGETGGASGDNDGPGRFQPFSAAESATVLGGEGVERGGGGIM